MGKDRTAGPPDVADESPLALALRRAGLAVASPAAATTPAPPPPAAPAAVQPDLARGGKLVLRRERKGHGGKTVTRIEGLEASPAALEALARDLRKALGCGAVVDDGTVVLQGDLAERVEDWLRAHGATRVVRGS